MAETRSDLAVKVETLENQVAETVQSATEAVNETVDNVKETVDNVTSSVEETVQSIGDFFDLRHQTEQHPWLIFGGSVALGCLAAHLFVPTEKNSQQEERRTAPPPSPHQQEPASVPTSRPESPARSEEFAEGHKSWLWEEMGRIKGLALCTLMGVVRDMAERSLQGELGKRVAEEVDRLTTKLGGQPIHGPVFPEKETGSTQS